MRSRRTERRPRRPLVLRPTMFELSTQPATGPSHRDHAGASSCDRTAPSRRRREGTDGHLPLPNTDMGLKRCRVTGGPLAVSLTPSHWHCPDHRRCDQRRPLHRLLGKLGRLRGAHDGCPSLRDRQRPRPSCARPKFKLGLRRPERYAGADKKSAPAGQAEPHTQHTRDTSTTAGFVLFICLHGRGIRVWLARR